MQCNVQKALTGPPGWLFRHMHLTRRPTKPWVTFFDAQHTRILSQFCGSRHFFASLGRQRALKIMLSQICDISFLLSDRARSGVIRSVSTRHDKLSYMTTRFDANYDHQRAIKVENWVFSDGAGRRSTYPI